MLKYFNANAFHNLLNVLMLLFGALVTFDWTMLGVDARTALFITGIIIITEKVLKIVVNIARDGFTGLAKVQPPVEE
jgi:uncharacterized membrane protein